jgi:hypothetical protein
VTVIREDWQIMTLASIDPKYVPLLEIFLPFIVAFLASRLFYGWVNKAGLQSAGFSPTNIDPDYAPSRSCLVYVGGS